MIDIAALEKSGLTNALAYSENYFIIRSAIIQRVLGNFIHPQFKINSSKTTELVKSSERLVAKIDKIDFSTQLDKLDANISSINLAVQNLQTRIGGSERNLKDRLKRNVEPNI